MGAAQVSEGLTTKHPKGLGACTAKEGARVHARAVWRDGGAIVASQALSELGGAWLAKRQHALMPCVRVVEGH